MGEYDFVEDEKPDKIQGSLLKGYAAAFVAILILEAGVKVALSPESNLVHRLIAYMLGIGVIFVLALMTKSIWKMVFFGTPIVTIAAFVPPRLLPNVFADLFGEFLYLDKVFTEIVKLAENSSFSSQVDPAIVESAKQYLPFLFVIDIVIGLIVLSIAGLGLVLLVRLFAKKPNILTIFSIVFMIVFLILGVVVLPYTMTVTSGVAQFSADMAIGGFYVAEGINELQKNMNTGNFSEATRLLNQAAPWFEDARSVLLSLEQLGVTGIANQVSPEYGIIIENGFLMVEGIVHLSNGLAPFVVGLANLKLGFEKAFSEFNSSGFQGLMLAQTDEEFEEGLEFLRQGMNNLSAALDDIKEGINVFTEMDRDALKQAIQSQTGDEATAQQVDMAIDAASLLNITLDMFQVIINPVTVNGTESEFAPLIHLILGARSLNDASQIIGKNTDFQGTGSFFADVVSNLTVFRTALDDKAFDDFEAFSSQSKEITDLYGQITGGINFLKDSSDVSIKLGEFGQQIVPLLTKTNQSLSIFRSTTNFTEIDDETYNSTYDDLGTVVTSAQSLNVTAHELDALVKAMMANSNNESYYGLFTEPSKQMASMLSNFNVTQNAQNFIYLGHAFRNVIRTAQTLKATEQYVKHIQNDIQEIEDSSNKTQTIIDKKDPITANITETDRGINTTLEYVENARTNFTLAFVEGGMTQLSNVNEALSNIIEDIKAMQGDQGLGKIKEIMDDPAAYVIANGIDQTVQDLKDAVAFINTKFQSINGHLSNMNLNA